MYVCFVNYDWTTTGRGEAFTTYLQTNTTATALYLKMAEEIAAAQLTASAHASGGGRMHVTMDRYEADWGIVERGWKAHVLGIFDCQH